MTTLIWGTAAEEPLPELSPWDVVTVCGIALPGIARVGGQGIEREFKEKHPPGYDGSTVTDQGRAISKFTITLELARQSEWDGFETMIPMLQPVAKSVKTGKQELQPVTVAHPAISVLGVTSGKFRRIGVPHPSGKIGVYEVDLELWEHREPVLMVGKGTGTKAVSAEDMVDVHGLGGLRTVGLGSKAKGVMTAYNESRPQGPSKTNAGP